MDSIDPVIGTGTPGAPPAIPTPAGVHPRATQAEIDALVAVVPSVCRSSAVWAVPLLLDTARNRGITHLGRIAYVLATAQHAANFGARLEERGSGPIRDGVDWSFEHYEPHTRLGAALGNTESGDGERFRGRGFVQIKGRSAYALWSQRLGLPDQLAGGVPVPYFVAHPAALARPDIAAHTLVRGMRDGLFTGFALGYYINDRKTDFYRARRVVDGPEHAREVAAIATVFAKALEDVQTDRHRLHMEQLARAHDARSGGRDPVVDLRNAVERLAARG